MKIQNILAGKVVGAYVLLTALVCWGFQDNKPLVYRTIHEAAKNGDLADVTRHLVRGADVNSKDKDGCAPLHLAVSSGHKDVVELLIAKGADVNAKDDKGQTPLYEAAGMGSKDVAELLIAKGANVKTASSDGETPLHVAADYCQKDVAELLIAKGADVNAKDKNGRTPLFKAAMPLFSAFIEGQKDFAELLIAKGADVNVKDNNGTTPLQGAGYAGKMEIVELLKKHGARENQPSGSLPSHPLNRTIHEAAKNGDLAGVKNHLARGADVNSKDKDGWTPLHLAVKAGYKDVVELLIAKGADVNAKDKFGETPLIFAASAGNKDVFEVLIAKGADVNSKDVTELTPLLVAAMEGHKELAELLIAKGADVNAKDIVGATTLFMAVSGRGHKDRAELVELLIAKGADVNAKDQLGWTPLYHAEIDGKKDIVEILKKHGARENQPSGSLPSHPPEPESTETFAPLRILDDMPKAKIIKQVGPIYPEDARKAKVEGMVIIEATTDEQGKVIDAIILRSVPLLDKAALAAVKQWIYEPYIYAGKPRPIIFTVTVRFSLK
jgi:cytohesin